MDYAIGIGIMLVIFGLLAFVAHEVAQSPTGWSEHLRPTVWRRIMAIIIIGVLGAAVGATLAGRADIAGAALAVGMVFLVASLVLWGWARSTQSGR